MSRPERVVYVLPHYDVRSAEHFAHVLPFLEALARRITLAVVIERCTGTPAIAGAERVEILPPGRPWRRMLSLARVLVRLRRAGYRKIFVRISTPAGLVAGSVGRALGITSYYWNSGQGKNAAPPWRPGLRAFARRLRYEMALVPLYTVSRLVHHFVTGPASMAPYYAEHYGVNPRKIVIFANDIDLDAFSARLAASDPAATRRRFGVTGDDDVVLFVGRVSPLKGGEFLLPIVQRVIPRRPRAKFLIVGDVHLPAFTAELERHPNRSSVVLLGSVPNIELPPLYAAADLFILPSRSEGFPRVLLECMAAGLPFVAFDVGGVREIADSRHGAWIVPPTDVERFADRVVELLERRDLRRELGEAARERVKRFATPAVVELFAQRIAEG